VDYSDNSSNPANLAMICPVDVKIIGLRGIVKNKKQQQNIEPAAALLLHRSRAGQSSAGLTMWQVWQMPRASGLRGPPEVEEIFSARQ